MEKNELLVYEAPLVEIIEVEVEKGFATSQTGNYRIERFVEEEEEW